MTPNLYAQYAIIDASKEQLFLQRNYTVLIKSSIPIKRGSRWTWYIRISSWCIQPSDEHFFFPSKLGSIIPPRNCPTDCKPVESASTRLDHHQREFKVLSCRTAKKLFQILRGTNYQLTSWGLPYISFTPRIGSEWAIIQWYVFAPTIYSVVIQNPILITCKLSGNIRTIFVNNNKQNCWFSSNCEERGCENLAISSFTISGLIIGLDFKEQYKEIPIKYVVGLWGFVSISTNTARLNNAP